MAKVIGPLFCLSAHGKVGPLIYETGQFGQYVKGDTPQRKKPTEAQRQQNYFFGVCADLWRSENDATKAEYDSRALSLHMTGFNLYIKENIQHP